MCLNCNIFPEDANFTCPICGKNQDKFESKEKDSEEEFDYYQLDFPEEYWEDIKEHDNESF
jgi:uncharacterized Zn finger protein (UPF0148 family)